MGEALSTPDGPEGQAQAAGALDPANESVLMSQLIKLLQSRERQSLLLSDLGALLPGLVRQRVKDQGGLRSWLQRYPSLFSVVGQPGKESVTLVLGASPQEATLPDAYMAGGDIAEAAIGANADGDEANPEDDIDSLSAVQLRGLPYRATLEDLVTFLAEHSSDLAENNAVQLVQNRDGRPSGFARVQFTSPESAKKCVADLHLRSMDDRYVEVFLYSERPSKGRQRRGGHEDGTAAPGDAVRLTAAADVSGMTRDQVVWEVRQQMADPKARRQLLSMLGVALSPNARSYLKQMDQGLKHFLGQFPTEFSVDGGKGCEYVTYTPAQLSLSAAIDGFDGAEAAGEPKERRLNASPKSTPAHLAQSPAGTGPASATRGYPDTPSNYGTPDVQDMYHPAAWGVPAWPQGGAPPFDPNPFGSWPMQNQFGGWPGAFPGGGGAFPAWGAPNLDGMPADAAQAAALAAFNPGGMAAATQATTPSVSQQRADLAAPMPMSSAPTVAAVRLRGLPFTSVEQDVLAFFAQHDIVDRIAEGPKAVNILTRSNGRPSGQAIVQMGESADAEIAQSVLHGQWMGSRYIEVFLLTAEEHDAQTSQQLNAPGTAPAAKASQQEPISLSMGVSAPNGMPSAPSVPYGAHDPGMAPPPWQLGMWNAAMAGGAVPGSPPPLGAANLGGESPNASSWEALFQFLGPANAAAAMGGMQGMGQPPPMDFAAMGGYGLPDPNGQPAPGMPSMPAPGGKGAPAAAAV